MSTFPTETGYVEDLSQEEKEVQFDKYTAELEKYHTDPMLSLYTYNAENFYFYDGTPDRKIMSYTFDSGVDSCNIVLFDINKDNTEAKATVKLQNWVTFIEEDERGIWVNTIPNKWHIEYIMKKVDGEWKISDTQGMYQLDSKSDPQLAPGHSIRYYDTFTQALEAAEAMEMD